MFVVYSKERRALLCCWTSLEGHENRKCRKGNYLWLLFSSLFYKHPGIDNTFVALVASDIPDPDCGDQFAAGPDLPAGPLSVPCADVERRQQRHQPPQQPVHHHRPHHASPEPAAVWTDIHKYFL